MEKDHSTLTTQLEYYFSDANLQYDEFFHNEIEHNADGFLALDLLLNCNKIKKLNSTFADLQEAVKASKLLELNKGSDSVRRKDKKLPDFKGKKKGMEMTTRASRKNSEKSVASQLKEKEAAAEDDNKVFAPVLLVMTNVDTLPKNGKLIEETVGKQYNCVIPYARVNRSNGHLVLDKNDPASSEVIEKLLKDGFQFDDQKIEIIPSDDRERNQFNKENLSYLEKIVKKKFGKSIKKAGKIQEKKLFNAVTFAGKKYNNFSGLQTAFKNIISKSRNGVEVDDDESKVMIEELLKYHDSGAAKLKGAKGFVVDFHPTYKQTRCFFIVRDDGNEDFSMHKCLNNLKDKIMAE